MSTEGESIVAEATEVEVAPTEAPTLPSDTVEFEVPEKFEGKSIEDVIKSYQELEKLKGGGQESTEEANNPLTPTEEKVTEPTEVEQESYDKYAKSLDDNGSLSDAEYAELAKAGYDKATVDKEIADRADRKEYNQYKADKTLNDVLEPLGGGVEKFKEVAAWANESKTAEEVKAFNDALGMVPKIAQQAMLKGLYEEYTAAGVEVDTILHTNSAQSRPNKGYSTQEEFFKDVGSPEYKTNPKYREAVEAKMAKSDLF